MQHVLFDLHFKNFLQDIYHITGNEVDYTTAPMLKSIDADSLDIRHVKIRLRMKSIPCVFANNSPLDFSLLYFLLP